MPPFKNLRGLEVFIYSPFGRLFCILCGHAYSEHGRNGLLVYELIKIMIMTISEFMHEKPILKGNIFVNGRNKSGIFKPEWNKYSNSVCYRYYTYKGHRGEGGFTLSRAYYYFENGTLFLNN
jgi:hypothetical protein